MLFRLRKDAWTITEAPSIEKYDYTSEGGITHPEGDDPPLPRQRTTTKSTTTTPGGAATSPRPRSASTATDGRGSGGSSRGGGRGRGSGGRKRPASALNPEKYGPQSLSGTTWWGGECASTAVYERRLFSVSSISVAWSPAVSIRSLSGDGSGGSTQITTTTTTNTTTFSVLAVGTKEGSVWLWRCEHPAVPASPMSGDDEKRSLTSRLTLIGSVGGGNLSWVSAMKWVSIPAAGGSSGDGGEKTCNAAGATDSFANTAASFSRGSDVLVLAVGASDGSVTLWGAPASNLINDRPSRENLSESPMTKLSTPMHPDLVPVTSLDMCLKYPPAINTTTTTTTTTTTVNNGNGGTTTAAVSQTPAAEVQHPHLVIAIGKSAGQLGAWTSAGIPPFSPSSQEDSRQQNPITDKSTFSQYHRHHQHSSAAAASLNTVQNAVSAGHVVMVDESIGFGSHTLTGVTLELGGDLLVGCSREGGPRVFMLSRNTATGEDVLVPGPQLMPCTKRKQKEEGFGAYGVARSPGGLFVAVPRASLPAGVHYVK